ncbi:heme-thiolate peroxidase [Gelatoporia subvermispora B]|uniref:Heme-thiolate peroxidase n=1 Tax=Ceriporiopsis subvermispora (strain B) TaxID=914234 RepID=M2PKQ6_CERS8|nr:heme-thiolate peroxidase [Gelatoporia subvermispora B]
MKLLAILALTSVTYAFPATSWSKLAETFNERRIRNGLHVRQSDPEPLAVVDGLTKIPDDDHPFMAPGPTDQRGPCPGLNTLANHGYLPRNGIVTQADILSATAAGFNMGADLAEVVSTIAIAYDGDLITSRLSIGGPDNRTSFLGSLQNIFGVEGGLDHHASFETDTSATRDDAFFGNDYTMMPNLYAQMKSIAAQHGGLYNLDAMKDLQLLRYQQSIATNPTFYLLPLQGPLNVIAKTFIPAFFSNGTYGAGGVPNEASISAFFGAELLPNGSFTAVPERFPDNWYRRGTPFQLSDAFEATLDLLNSTGIVFGANAGQVNSFLPLDLAAATNVNGLACILRDAIQANVPTSISQPIEIVEQVISSVVDLIDPLFGDFGCPAFNASQTQAYAAINKINNGSS